jgi:signal transduction histidine kinase
MAVRPRIEVHRSTIMLLATAILLPSLIFVALQFGFGYRAERHAYETSTVARADAIMAAIDGNMQRTRASALALATAAAIQRHDWRKADERIHVIASLNPDWKSVRLLDVAKGQELIDTQRAFGTPVPFRTDPGLLESIAGSSILFDRIERNGSACPCLTVAAPVREDGAIRYLLMINLDPGSIQSLLVSQAPKEGISAIVDRQGNFIARTRDYANRVGTPATRYTLAAVRRGIPGIYSAVSYEGQATYGAMSKSQLTGWSTHVGVPKTVLDAPMRWSHFATAMALLASLALAVGLTWALSHMIASQRRADQRIQQAERLEAVGKMTGGIAHDFNNMLAIVIGSLDLAKRRRASGRDDIDRYLDNAMEGASRAAELTRRLLAFSRRQALVPSATDINRLIEGMRELLGRTLDETIIMRFDLAGTLCCAFVDPGQLENAIVNLAVNARDAMPRGGELIIASANITLSAPQAARMDIGPGEYVRVRVIDSGEGMSAETIKRAFEPFFTTKDVGRGTGLGLSQIYGFLDQSGGRARIQSQEGEGTTVELFLPRFQGELPAKIGAQSSSATLPTGSADEIILVTEDEDKVRQTNVEALRDLGYSVRHAANGSEALEILSTQPGVKLLFTDIVMPGMNGRELAREARQRLPDLKLLFATGYERETVSGGDKADGENLILRKPFAIDQLARKVRDVLDA